MQSSESATELPPSKEDLSKRYSEECMRLGDAIVQRERASNAIREHLEVLAGIDKAATELAAKNAVD